MPADERPALLFVTQTVDEDDPALGRVVGMIRALGERSRRLVVIANETGRVPDDLPATVLSLGKEHGAKRAEKTVRYLHLLMSLTRERRWDGLLAHMCPEYLLLAAPVCRRYRVPTYLWYTHPYCGRRLRLAEKLADEVLTSLEGSYPGRSARVNVIGHAIDVDEFPVRPLPPRPPLVLLALGRTSPVKNLRLAVEGVALAGGDTRLRVVGPSVTAEELAHRAELVELVHQLDVADRVSIEPGVPATAIPDLLAGSHGVVNTTRSGSGDKVVFESLMSGRLAVTTNPSFQQVLRAAPELLVAPTANAIAAQVAHLAVLSARELEALAVGLRETVVAEHSAQHWAEEVVALVDRRRAAERG